jgi:uncharacterized protein DUF6894
MPRYFFHLHTESRIDPDLDGAEFPSLQAAVADARQARTEYMRDEGIEGDRLKRRCRFEITDESRRFVATVPAADN